MYFLSLLYYYSLFTYLPFRTRDTIIVLTNVIIGAKVLVRAMPITVKDNFVVVFLGPKVV